MLLLGAYCFVVIPINIRLESLKLDESSRSISGKSSAAHITSGKTTGESRERKSLDVD